MSFSSFFGKTIGNNRTNIARIRVSDRWMRSRLFSGGEGPKNDQDQQRDKAARFVWSTSVIGTVAIFGGGLATGYETLFPAWAFFHSCGACASYIQRQPFEVFMHSAVMLGVLMYWGQDSGLIEQSKNAQVTQDSIVKLRSSENRDS
jgi:hypothetical protein